MINDNVQSLIDFVDFDKCKDKVLYLKGTFGVGKSYLISKFKHEYFPQSSDYLLYDYNHSQQVEYLHEFVYNLAMSCNCRNLEDPNECFANRNNFQSKLNQSYSIDKKLYETIKQNNKLKNVPAFFAQPDVTLNPIEIKSKYELSHYDFSTLFEACEMSAESFIVDLISSNYVNQGGNEVVIPAMATQILFIIDNYDKVAGSVNNWIVNHFIETIENKDFSDYKYYDIKTFPVGSRAKDFINCKFIMASREDLKPVKTGFAMQTLPILPLEKEQIISIFERNNIDVSGNFELVHQITQGLPYLIDLVLESVIVGEGEIQDLSRIEQLAGLRAMNYFSEQEQDFVRAAAFFSKFNESTLNFMPLIKDKAEYAYLFLKNSSEFAEAIADDYYTIKPLMKLLIKNKVEDESQKVYQTLETISSLYDAYSELMGNFQPEEQMIICQLAYFKNFDRIYAVQEFFGEKAASVRKIIDKYPVVFGENNFTLKMEDNIANFIVEFEKIARPEQFDEANRKISSIWTNYIETLNKDLKSIEKSFDEISSNVSTLEQNDSKLGKENETLALSLDAASKEYSELSDSIMKFKIESNPLWWAVPMVSAALMGYLIYFSDIALAKFISNSLGFIMWLTLSFSGFRLYKYLISSNKRGDYDKNSVRHKELEIQKSKSANRIKAISQERESLQPNLKKISLMRAKLESEISSIKMKLKESFVREETI